MTFECHATPLEVMRAVETLQEFAALNGVSEQDIFCLALSLEECASNIVNHALQRNPELQFCVSIERRADVFVVELRDHGPEFDPTAAPARAEEAVDEDLPGGWGIGLARRNCSEICYTRREGENILRLTKQLSVGAA